LLLALLLLQLCVAPLLLQCLSHLVLEGSLNVGSSVHEQA